MNKSNRLDAKTRKAANKELVAAGFGGMIKFQTIGKALNAAGEVTGKHGMEWTESIPFLAPNGYVSIHLAWTNPEDSFSPVEITNSVLAFSWTTLGEDCIEVIAYLS